MVGDAAQKAADKVKPLDDALAQIDQPADDNTWHDTPNFSRDSIRNQFKSTYSQNKPVSGQDLRDAAGDAAQAAHPSGSRDPSNVANMAAQDQRYGTTSGVNAQSGIQSGANTLRDRASTNLPDDTKDRARQTRERTMNYLKQKIPENRRERTIWRLKKMIVEIQGHPDCEFLHQFLLLNIILSLLLTQVIQ
jgi:hypothetical protein